MSWGSKLREIKQTSLSFGKLGEWHAILIYSHTEVSVWLPRYSLMDQYRVDLLTLSAGQVVTDRRCNDKWCRISGSANEKRRKETCVKYLHNSGGKNSWHEVSSQITVVYSLLVRYHSTSLIMPNLFRIWECHRFQHIDPQTESLLSSQLQL